MTKEEINMIAKIVSTNEVAISTDEKPIIGTSSLATCTGVLLYSKRDRRAIVAHISSGFNHVKEDMLELVKENKLDSDNNKIMYKVIPGAFEEHYGLVDKLNETFQQIPDTYQEFSDEEVNPYIRFVDMGKDSISHEFAFNAETGKFVSDKIFDGFYDDSGVIIKKGPRQR